MRMWGNFYGGYGYRRVTNNDIKEAIALDISKRYRYRNINIMDFIYDKIDLLPEKPWKHSCIGVGVSEQLPIRIIVGDGVPVFFIYCNQCNKVIYYVEQVY